MGESENLTLNVWQTIPEDDFGYDSRDLCGAHFG